MSVNSVVKRLFDSKLLLASAMGTVILVIFFIASSFTNIPDRDILSTRANLLIRAIGHQLLLEAGDSSSRVLPVTEIKEGTFLLGFENQYFSFNHDSLMALSRRLFPETDFPSGYTVTVNQCLKASIIYGFQVNSSTPRSSPSILACSGRSEPLGCYSIQFAFHDLYKTRSWTPMIGAVCTFVLAATTLLIVWFRKRDDEVVIPPKEFDQTNKTNLQSSYIGKFSFDPAGQRLLLDTEVISLTDKECRVLELLNQHFGELISRETLLQKIWLEEGVVTGRSLDMFISKLRKKLSADPNLRITNVHGKGYKLELHEPQNS